MTDRQTLKILGRNIKGKRLSNELTQEALAEMVGVHWHTIQNIERGISPFSVTTFIRLLYALGAEAHELLKGIPGPDLLHLAEVRKAKARKRKSPVQRSNR